MVKVKLNEQKKQFDVLPKGSEDGFYIDGILRTNLELIKKQLRKDWDYVFVVDGIEGGGKSVFAQQAAFYVSDGKFNVENICFTPKEFKEAVLASPKYGCVIFDEAFRGLSSRAAMTETNRVLISLLQEIRQKNLCVFIVLPSVYDLDKYVALHRARGVFHVHTDVNKHRGFFKFYNKNKLTYMIANIQKMRYKYPASPSFKGRFADYYPLGKENYKDKKLASLGDYVYENQRKATASMHEKQAMSAVQKFVALQNLVKEITGMNYVDMEKKVGLNPSTGKYWRQIVAERGLPNLTGQGVLAENETD